MNVHDIQRRWAWDDGFPATLANIEKAIRRTGNSYGITVAGKPYLEPQVGMRVSTRLWYSPNGNGTIIALHHNFGDDADPEAEIRLDDGRVVYLHQTALNGYTPVPAPATRKEPQ